jgi:hypothetical protein
LLTATGLLIKVEGAWAASATKDDDNYWQGSFNRAMTPNPASTGFGSMEI